MTCFFNFVYDMFRLNLRRANCGGEEIVKAEEIVKPADSKRVGPFSPATRQS